MERDDHPGADDAGRGDGAVRDATASSPPGVRIDIALDPRVNFALQQNAVPFVKRIVVANGSAADLTDVVVEVSTFPDVSEPAVFRVDRIATGAAHVIAPVDVRLRHDVLVAQQEREAGTLRVHVTAAGVEVAEASRPFEVLAYDEWNGTASLPEILAAFVLPNHPEVARILGRARDLLGDRTGNPSLDGYQARDPRRVLAVTEAVYDAIRAMDLTYASPPASFESNGQKVRTPDRIADLGMATCLDLVLLFAACLEQAGLHPVVVLVEGHAFAGVWLVDDSFPETATAEPYRLLKRVELDVLRVFETTGVATRPQVPFPDAVREGRRRLEAVDRFQFSVDVRSARRARIRPIPLRAAPGAVAVVTEVRAVPEPADDLRPIGPITPDGASSDAGPQTAAARGRIDRWKRKLLDLSLRNRLLNHRETKQVVPLLLPDVVRIEDALAKGRALEIVARRDTLRGADPRDAELRRERTGEDGLREFVADELAARRVHASVDADDLGGRLLEMSRTARLSLEEGGANTLYLAIGFLSWYETPSSEEARAAPLLLLPVALERRTALDPFRMRLFEDDARVNVTLVQKLRSEWGVEVRGIDPLPEDDDGVDVAAVLRAFREAVLPLPRWHVREDAAIGIFSFTKYLMWLDLEARQEVLARNEVVRHLIAGGGSFGDGRAFPDERHLDDDRDPASTFCPLDADSSQLAAVHAAADGRSFVLQGPPGTGKSQTITNLIVHSLAAGKRVLFLSEKMAALDVVHRRLENVGVGPFCLPLHSNRAQKKEVLDRLGEALGFGAETAPAEWAARARDLQAERAVLNRVCRALHEPRAFAISAFGALSQLIGLRTAHESALDLGDPAAAADDLPERLRRAVTTLVAEARETGGVAGHPLAAVRLDRWTPGAEADARRLGNELVAATDALERTAAPVAKAMGLAEGARSCADVARMADWCALLAEAPTVDVRALAASRDWDTARAEALSAVAEGRDRDARRAALFGRFRPEVLDAPLDAWRTTLQAAAGQWVLLRWWNGRGVRKGLDLLRTAPAVRDDGDRLAELDEAIALRDVQRRVAASDGAGARTFGSSWRDGEADWDSLERAVAWTGRLRDLLSRTAGADLDQRARLRDRWVRLVSEGRDLFLRDGVLVGECAVFATAAARHAKAREDATAALSLDATVAFGDPDTGAAFDGARATGTALVTHASRLRPWCGYQRARAEALALGLGPMVTDFEDGVVPPDRLPECLERSLHAWWLRRVLAAEPLLADFSSTRHALAIDRFRALERRVLDLTGAIVRARLAEGLPRADPAVSGKSEMGILQRQRALKARHMPLRKLFQQIPNALARLKPCLLMSPLSVAQYLSPDHPPFDLVVFDEASQIPVWDAIGAIARGTHLVVVGDSKQLPPTSFFEKEETEEELDEDDVEDLESILDECVAAGLPPRTLDWHYRSRHESLIAFSNRHYYGDRLHTFPSAAARVAGFGVSLRPVPDGVYDKGHTRSNRREAEVLVADLVRRLRDPRESKRSIGIVTFSMAQQTLVENLIEAERRRHPELEGAFAQDVREPLFVKNLENVQGDERDVILFSVCYGPDAQRRVYMNFGPLNRTGGERRLNVAITRAREEVVVFSTLRAEQIDLARTRAVGVQDLKAFLEYAERGPAALGDAAGNGTAVAAADAPFEADVERALAARGWIVHRRVGCSTYRVDLAVIDPERPGRYVLGIETDGTSYDSGNTARDRDRLRADVLRGLGWKLHRVWSADWWLDPEREVERFEAAIVGARAATEAEESAAAVAAVAGAGSPGGAASDRSGDRAHRVGGPDVGNAAGAAATGFPVGSTVRTTDGSSGASAGGSAGNPQVRMREIPADGERGTGNARYATNAPDAPYATDATDGSGRVAESPDTCVFYDALATSCRRGRPEHFAEPFESAGVARALREVVDAEGPVLLDVATRRTAAMWDVARVTSKVSERVASVLRAAGVRVTREDGDVVLWRADADPSAFREFRRPRDPAAPERTIDQIPLVELALAVDWVLAAHLSAPIADIARDTARVFGVARVGSGVRARIERAVEFSARAGRCKVEGEIVTALR